MINANILYQFGEEESRDEKSPSRHLSKISEILESLAFLKHLNISKILEPLEN